MKKITTAVAVIALVAGGAVAVSTMTADAQQSSSSYTCTNSMEVNPILEAPQTVEGDSGTPVAYEVGVSGFNWSPDFFVTPTSAVGHTQNGTVQLYGDGAGSGSAIAGEVSEQVETIERIETTWDDGSTTNCTLSFGDSQPTVILHPIIPPVPPTTTVPPGPGPGPGPGPNPQPTPSGERAEPVVGQPRYAG